MRTNFRIFLCIPIELYWLEFKEFCPGTNFLSHSIKFLKDSQSDLRDLLGILCLYQHKNVILLYFQIKWSWRYRFLAIQNPQNLFSNVESTLGDNLTTNRVRKWTRWSAAWNCKGQSTSNSRWCGSNGRCEPIEKEKSWLYFFLFCTHFYICQLKLYIKNAK